MVTGTTSTRVRLFHPKSMTDGERADALMEIARSYETPTRAVHMLIGAIAACVNSAANIGNEEDVIEVCGSMNEKITAACIDCFRQVNGTPVVLQ